MDIVKKTDRSAANLGVHLGLGLGLGLGIGFLTGKK